MLEDQPPTVHPGGEENTYADYRGDHSDVSLHRAHSSLADQTPDCQNAENTKTDQGEPLMGLHHLMDSFPVCDVVLRLQPRDHGCNGADRARHEHRKAYL